MIDHAMFSMMLVPLLVVLAIFVIPVAQIVHKAGYSRLWLLIWLVPIVNLVFLWIFAFSRWPVEARGLTKAAE
jgi:hypothetical protein